MAENTLLQECLKLSPLQLRDLQLELIKNTEVNGVIR